MMMMINLSLLIVVIFAVLKIRTEDSPITAEEQIDLAKRFSADDLKRARDLGFSDRSILRTTSNGWALEEMMRMISADVHVTHENDTISNMCDVMFPNQKRTTLTITSAQEINLKNLYHVTETHFLRELDQRPFLQNFVCAYSAQPDSFDADAKSFGSTVLLYMKIRIMKTKVEQASGDKRIFLVKEMCCLYQWKKDKIIGYVNEFRNTGLRDADLDDFNEQWDSFASANTSKTLENVCDFLHAKITFKECPEYVFL